MTDFNYIKGLYEDGYRCIYHNSENDSYTIYLKNFDSEKSEVVELSNSIDFSQFQSYVNDLKMY